jgi:hypothetical protein
MCIAEQLSIVILFLLKVVPNDWGAAAKIVPGFHASA